MQKNMSPPQPKKERKKEKRDVQKVLEGNTTKC